MDIFSDQSMDQKEKRRAYCRAYYKANRTRILAKHYEYREKNREAVRECNRRVSRRRRAERGDEVRAYARKHYSANAEKFRAKNRKSLRAKFYSAMRGFPGKAALYPLWVAIVEKSRECAYCFLPLPETSSLSLDHRIPISRAGRIDDPTNWAVSCWPCNREKQQMTDIEYGAHLREKAERIVARRAHGAV